MSHPPLLDGILKGSAAQQRRAIAKAITLLESTRADHRAQGDELLTALLPHTGGAFRLGISGVPGVGNLGKLQAGALEESNIDLTAELVNMITAQRAYQANAQTIKTQDQVLQTLVNLR